jgi:hypothetical protein
MIYLCNAFSLNMLDTVKVKGPNGEDLSFPCPYVVEFRPVAPERAADFLCEEGGWVGAIGHADTARLVAALLGIDIPANRATVVLGEGDCAVVAQYSGPRLPEGATTLPEGATITFWLAVVNRLSLSV